MSHKIGIFGLGISGISSLDFLNNLHSGIICWDDSEDNRQKIDSDLLLPLSHSDWQHLDTIIVSPGIPNSHAVYALAADYNILISSDIELFLQLNHDSEIIAITGTNGKSTVTSLVGHILTKNNLDYHIGGNIGLPALSLPPHAKGYVLELSSFQLDLLKQINPTIGVLLNLSPDHLDRHGTYSAYCSAKEKILQGDGLKIIGTTSPDSRKIYNKLHKSGEKNIVPIGHKDGLTCDAQKLVDNFFDFTSYDIPTLPTNHENIACAFAICRALGVEASNIVKHLASFEGLKHRMQLVGSHKQISFYNDSKATNVHAAESSLSSLKNIFWLAGGIFKSENLLPLENHIKNVKKAYLFGKNKLIFEEYLKGKVDYVTCNTMEEAFNKATNDALGEENLSNILLSPACSSFDQFKNFEDRGNNFINLYNERFQ